MKNILHKSFFKEPMIFQFIIGFFCLFAILFVLVTEYFFLILPCKLCLYERYPYYISMIIACIIIRKSFLKKEITLQIHKRISILYIIIFLVSVILSSYHIGVEKGLFLGPSSCGGEMINTDNIEMLKIYLSKQKTISCSVSNFRFIFSFTEWNLLLSIFLTIIAILYFKYNISKSNIALKLKN